MESVVFDEYFKRYIHVIRTFNQFTHFPHPHHDKTTNTYILLLGSTLYANQIYIGFYKGTSDQ